MKNKKDKMPDFDKMWNKIKDRLDHPHTYYIENLNTGMWLAEYEDIHYCTIYPRFAMAFVGKGAKEAATYYLYVNQSNGLLKGFKVAEYLPNFGADLNLKCVSPKYWT